MRSGIAFDRRSAVAIAADAKAVFAGDLHQVGGLVENPREFAIFQAFSLAFAGYAAGFEAITVLVEIHAIPADRDAFRAQPQPLLEAVFAGEKNPAFGAQNAVPGNGFPAGAQSPDNLTRGSGMSARRRDVAVCRDFAFRNPPH